MLKNPFGHPDFDRKMGDKEDNTGVYQHFQGKDRSKKPLNIQASLGKPAAKQDKPNASAILNKRTMLIRGVGASLTG